VLVISKMVLRITVDFPMEKKPNMTLSQQYSELYVVDDSLSLSLVTTHYSGLLTNSIILLLECLARKVLLVHQVRSNVHTTLSLFLRESLS